jgi:hypothetical protein
MAGGAASRIFASYAAEYLRTMLPTCGILGATDAQTSSAGAAPGRAAFHGETARHGPPTDVERGDQPSAWDFARWLSAILRAEGEDRDDGTRRRCRRSRRAGAPRASSFCRSAAAFDA